jgi:predicted regulator of Ras-like GTPase activity (Roadblock/LC7/MglB family)
MELPAGTDEGKSLDPRNTGTIQYLMDFCGLLEIATPRGNGFLLTNKGNLVAAYYKNDVREYRGGAAIRSLMEDSSDAGCSGSERTFRLLRYTDSEFEDARDACREMDLLADTTASEAPAGERQDMSRPGPTLFDDESLEKITGVSGVIAVSVFYEGFPVQSKGDADFEHIAALAEDLRRQGTRIASDIRLGRLTKLTLEAGENTIIIAPFGDLFLCIIAQADAPLEKIGRILRTLQTGVPCGGDPTDEMVTEVSE